MNWGWNHVRRQDLAEGGAKNQREGPKTRRGRHIFKMKYWIYAGTGGPNVKWRGTDFKWGAGTTGHPAGDGPGRNVM